MADERKIASICHNANEHLALFLQSNAVDPHQLLTALAPLLTPDGAMKNEAQVPRISGYVVFLLSKPCLFDCGLLTAFISVDSLSFSK